MSHPTVWTFETALGWVALVGSPCGEPDRGRGKDDPRVLKRVAFGFPSGAAACEHALGDRADEAREENWDPDLEEALLRYAVGEEVGFDHVDVDLSSLTPFARRVLDRCRRIPFGRRMSYRELAEQAGSPRAARAVGNVMASNRYPVIIPCHRVVASGGRLGGYSSPQGLSLKERLLEMEAGEP